MYLINDSKGVSIVVAIFAIVILAFMGVVFLSLVNISGSSSVNDYQSAQALYVAQGGIEAAKRQFQGGTACGLLAAANTNIALGRGTYTILGTAYNPASVSLTSGITAASTVIPVSAVAGFAPQGRIMIENEAVWYGSISGNSFINVRRGAGGTTAAAHPALAAVTQDQCRIAATGSVGSASRLVISDVAGAGSSPSLVSAGLDSAASTPISSTGLTNIGSITTSLTAGDNLIIAVVMLQNTSTTVANINAGNLQLRYGATVLASNQSLIRVVSSSNPPPAAGSQYNTGNSFPQKTYFFLYRHAGAPANPTYDILAQATANNIISGRVKMAAFNFSNVTTANSYFSNDGNTTLGNVANGTVLATHATGLAGGDNIILAAVELDNYAATGQTINATNLILRKGGGTGTTLNSNTFDIGFEGSGNAKRGGSYLLIARDATGAANQTYTVTGRATGNNAINGAVRMLVLQGIPFANMTTNTVNLTSTLTTLGSLATAFVPGDNIVITATQSMNYDWNNRNILADQLAFGGGGASTSNVVPIYLMGAITDDDYDTGLILYHKQAPANATYNWQSQSDAVVGLQPIEADTDVVALHFNRVIAVQNFGWQ
ncbi:MAG TPA: hypothetical protein VK654_15630 [Nitrospirota bacterium]|nr:hypothetical protein [Nitrospirota bacterium]